MKAINRLLLAAAALPLLAPASVSAALLLASNGSTLASFDSATPGTLLTSVPISGVTGGYFLREMDFRPSNGLLYALAINTISGPELLYTLNTATGAASLVGSVGIDFSTTFGMAFDPVADQIRVTGYNGSGQIRINPNTGASLGADTALAYAAGDVNTGSVGNLEGLAYTPAVGGLTTAYGLTAGGLSVGNNRLVRIGDVGGIPNGAGTGQVHTVAVTGVTSTSSWTFDITETLEAYAVGAFASTNQVYSVNLATGGATLLGNAGLTGPLTIAAAPVPEPGSALLLGLGTLGLLARRRRGKAEAVIGDK